MLTDAAARNAKPKLTDYKLHDSGGLLLYVTKKGTKVWRLKYRIGSKEKQLVLGRYPELGVVAAREARDRAKEQVKSGRDPSLLKKLNLTGDGGDQSFEALARRWHELNIKKWRDRHADDVIKSLERDVFPFMGRMHVDAIDEGYLLGVLKRIEDRGAVETAHRVRQRCERVFKMAKILGHAQRNPASDLSELLQPVARGNRWPAILEVDDLRSMIATLDVAEVSPVTRLASRFLALTAQRPGMIQAAEWKEFDFDFRSDAVPDRGVTWTIPASKMKRDLQKSKSKAYDHVVPLSRASYDVLKVVHELSGAGPFVFPSNRSSSEPMSENALSFLYKREGYKGRHVSHGWRSSFSTVMNRRAERAYIGSDRLFGERLFIDLMLAHLPPGVSATELIYNRAEYLERRREIGEEWASLIMEGQAPAASLLEGRRRRRS